MHRLRGKKAQGVLEYVIVLAAVIAALIAAAMVFKDPKTSGIAKLIDRSGTKINNAGVEILNITK